MSGVDDTRDRERTAVPPVLQHLAESSREWQPSARVEEALSAAWDAARAARVTGAVGATSSRGADGIGRSRALAAWGALAASLVAALVWWGAGQRTAGGLPATVADRGQAHVSSAESEPYRTEVAGPAARTVAVPSGPFEPPPPSPSRPAAKRAGESGSIASRPRSTSRPASAAASARLAQQQGQPDDVEPFVWLPAAEPIEPGLGLQVVRMTLPNARWDGRAPGQDAVQADVLMGDDGLARAVRVVRASSRP